MSAQRLDTILINEISYTLYGNPIVKYWEIYNNKPSLISFKSYLQSGYFADWEIHKGKLHLVKFYGENQLEAKTYSLIDVFPNETNKIFAGWFSGELTIPIGKKIDYSLSGIGSIYETMTKIIFENGVVKEPGVFIL